MKADPDCVFCKIVAGSIPALRVFEDETALAFLDIGPLAEGHTLVIPKAHFAEIVELPAPVMAVVAGHLPRLAQAVLKATGALGCNLLLNSGKVAGQEVPHLHWHIIPRAAGDGLGYRWNASTYPAGRGEALQARIRGVLGE